MSFTFYILVINFNRNGTLEAIDHFKNLFCGLGKVVVSRERLKKLFKGERLQRHKNDEDAELFFIFEKDEQEKVDKAINYIYGFNTACPESFSYCYRKYTKDQFAALTNNIDTSKTHV